MINKDQLRIFLEITFLYFLQGIPYGFQVKFLPLLMRRNGYELRLISLINLLSLPWILKFTWANFFDRFENSGRIWISGCLTLLSLASGFLNLNVGNLMFFLAILFLTSFLSASLDIAVDALAIKKFEEKDLGYCNVGHVVGYKIGILFGGGFLTVLNSHMSLEHFSIIQSVIYGVTAVYFLSANSLLFATDSKHKSTETMHLQHQSSSLMLFRILFTSKQLWLVGFVFLYKMGEQGFMSVYPLRLIDDEFDLTQIGLVTGIFGQIFSISGSSLGGIFISKFRIEVNRLLFLVALWRSFLLVLYSTFISSIAKHFVLHVIIESIFQLLAGIMTTATFTVMMMSSKSLPNSIHALHFTTIATFEVLGKLSLKSCAGLLTEQIGYDNFFFLCCILDFLVVFLTFGNYKSLFDDYKSVESKMSALAAQSKKER